MIRSILSAARPASLALLAAITVGCLEPARAADTVLYSFKGAPDGANPSSLIADTQGNLYGTTQNGGSHDQGTVFKLTPPAIGQAQWTETVLHSFTAGSEGGNPVAEVIFDTYGALYGTTFSGGSNGAGTVFKLTPPAAGKTQWTLSVLYTFLNSSSDGASPSGRLIFDTQGFLYGTTSSGGPNGNGTVFKLAPPASGTGPWTITMLNGFSGDGCSPRDGLIFDTQGALYGTCGGLLTSEVFKLTRPVSGTGWWTKSALFTHTFPPYDHDRSPLRGDLSFDTRGALYGIFGWGHVFKLTPSASGNGPWAETVIADEGKFVGRIALLFDLQGSLYGTSRGYIADYGKVFKLTPPAPGNGSWTETVLHSFKGGVGDGARPYTGLIFGPGGTLYGTTDSGGKSDKGTVFQISNPPVFLPIVPKSPPY